MTGILRFALMTVFVAVLQMSFPALFCRAARGQDAQAGMDDVALRESVRKALENGCAFLRGVQQADGSWRGDGRLGEFTAGATALAVLAQINCDVPLDSPELKKGLAWLRGLTVDDIGQAAQLYETSLVVMALCAADQPEVDLPRVQRFAALIEQSQIQQGEGTGLWSYQIRQDGGGGRGGGDASNGQYAVLALRDAATLGARVSRVTWERSHDYWIKKQAPSGGWGYNPGEQSARGSMTVAGLSTIAITTRMLQDDSDVDGEGRPDCCTLPAPNVAMEQGRRWMADNFSVRSNPGFGEWYYYYLYGLERAGRLSGVRFFGRYDWYRLGARQLVDQQLPGGNWLSSSGTERDAILNTSMALMFLSRGLSRVVINKLDFNSPNGESREAGEWNRHPWDVPALVELIDSLPKWPPRLTSQVVTLSRLRPESAVEELNQAPILFLSGRDAPQLTDQHISWLRDYVDNGGFIFACSNCDGQGFDQGFREIVRRMFPDGDASLQKLLPDHPIFRSEYLLNAEGIDLWGVDFGCRTSIVYSPEDLGCYWQKWMRHAPPERNADLSQRVLRATRVGVNVVAYATGREPPEKLSENSARSADGRERIERGLLQIARLRHNGGWDTAPRAVRNLLRALNETVGLTASTEVEAIPATLEELSRFPLICMHGRYRFQLPPQQLEAIREYLKRGGVLFADACCGATQFDRSFRDLVQQLYPESELKQIPADHDLYSARVGHEIREATRRRLVTVDRNASLQLQTEKGPPLLEGIEVDGRYVVIYSRHDISCALEHQAALPCDGYIEEDAAKLAVNVVLYAMLQDISWKDVVKGAPEAPLRSTPAGSGSGR
ncbi:MAG: DUF4159 domain-containing protein [Planctomycetaceae bacterium]